ncbi:unnamed protein product [Rotaria sordida]|uniref:Uncharacterized protein n=1 Tax=Rotaria sordida TaxID=392033 RepID=A0A815PKP6_9BILA|nr:unnamed protein product [Rotaria sordida]CAF3834558.1 unnamed protein product [Rotaria sordida]
MMLRQRYLSTDVLPFDSADQPMPTSSSSSSRLNIRKCKRNRIDATTQTTVIMTMSSQAPLKQQTIPHILQYTRPCNVSSFTSSTFSNSRLPFLLPVFPEMNDSNEFYPLFSNIPNHRLQACRVLMNFFLTSLTTDCLQFEWPMDPIVEDDDMKLYQHLSECPIALQVFLKCHPQYWCFVPMTTEQALLDDDDITPIETSRWNALQSTLHDAIQTPVSRYERDQAFVHWCIKHIPTPPPNYQFSIRQRLEQHSFFQSYYVSQPSRFLDLYNVSILMKHRKKRTEQVFSDLRIAESNTYATMTKSKSSYGKMNSIDMEEFHDMFDTIDENNDELEYTTDELNRYFFEVGHINSLIDESEIIEIDSLNDDNDDNIQPSEEEEGEEEEDVLSQQLSQLSTKNEDEGEISVKNKRRRRLSTTSSPVIISKKTRVISDNDDDDDKNIRDNKKKQDEIPVYLLATNESFNHLIQKIIQMNNSISERDIQQIAILMHCIANLQIKKQISMIYLQSGTGQLKEPEAELVPVDRRVWPTQVKSMFLAKRGTTTTTTTMEIIQDDNHLDCENFVRESLQETNDKIEQYQRQLDEKKSRLKGFTLAIQEAVETYVQQHGSKPLEMERDLQIASVKHDYEAEILERKYLQEQPNDYQIQVAQSLYEARSAVEEAKRELIELKLRIFYQKPSSSFNSS